MTVICGRCGSKAFRFENKNHRAVCSGCGKGFSVSPEILNEEWGEQNVLDFTEPDEIKIVDISGPSIKSAPPPHLRRSNTLSSSRDMEWENRKKKSVKPKPKRKVCRCK